MVASFCSRSAAVRLVPASKSFTSVFLRLKAVRVAVMFRSMYGRSLVDSVGCTRNCCTAAG